MALVAVGMSAQEYYDERPAAGDWGLGLNINMGAGSGQTNLGLGPKVQYYFTPAFRFEASFGYYLEAKHIIDWDLNANFHYVIPMKYGLSIYPIVGGTFMHRHWTNDSFGDKGRFGLNLGAGLQYDITPGIAAMYELKYQYVNDYDRCNMSIGIAFRL